MYLFFSDLHLGRSDHATERELEDDLIACLRANEHHVRGLYLNGDIFDEFIEYRHMIPKGFARLQGLLASWTDSGIPVTYLAGNHDPWHLEYYQNELGLRIIYDDVTDQLGEYTVHVSHGDDVDPTTPVYRVLRPLLRHPIPVFLYKYLLPGDTGFALARWVNRTFHGVELDTARIDGLRDAARHILCERKEVDLVVLGHSHQSELSVWPEGSYLNPGAWRQACTFGLLTENGPRCAQWNGSHAEIIEPAHALTRHL